MQSNAEFVFEYNGSVTSPTYDPYILRNQTEIVTISYINENSNSLALIGAGIKGKEDAEKSVELGSDGLLVASGILKTNDYKSIITDLVEGLGK